MTDGPKPHSWWHTLHGVLTAIAGIITAIAGLVVALYQAGLFKGQQSMVAPISTPTVESTARGLSPKTETTQGGGGISESSVAPSPKPLLSKPVNLLASENGGHLIVASGDDWLRTIDGKEGFNQISYGLSQQSDAVYAFRDEKLASIEMFTMLINQTGDNNVKEFELFVGSTSPTGPFESLGVLTTQNVKLFKTPYQEFKFSQVTAKYLKIKLLSTYNFPHPRVDEVQAFGRILE